jgi:hypothetical protein
MSYLYNVYAHAQRGRWGFTALTREGDVKTAFVHGDGTVTLESLDPLKLGSALQKNVRAGFKKEAQPKYLLLSAKDGVRVGQFVTQHPDLGADLDGERLFFVAVPEQIAMNEVVAAWSERLQECERAPRCREQWLAHCAKATAYVPAMTSDAHAALLVAQWARDNNLMLVSEGEAPMQGPEQQRHDWRNFLSQRGVEDIDTALADLGWPLTEALHAVPPVESTTPGGEDAWIALAQQVSF